MRLGDGSGVVVVVEKRGEASWWLASNLGELDAAAAAAVAKEKPENGNGERGE